MWVTEWDGWDQEGFPMKFKRDREQLEETGVDRSREEMGSLCRTAPCN